MDEQPPRPLVTRATRAHRPPAPKQSSSPVGRMIGCLAAGAWSLFFARWFDLSGGFLWIVASLGFVLIVLGFILAGVSINYWLERRQRHG